MLPLNWDRRQLPGHCGLLRLLNQQERKGATELNTKGKGDCPSMVEVRKRGDSSQVTPFNTNLLQPVQGDPPAGAEICTVPAGRAVWPADSEGNVERGAGEGSRLSTTNDK